MRGSPWHAYRVEPLSTERGQEAHLDSVKLTMPLQMAAAALGSFVVALLPYGNAFGMIALYGGFVGLGLAAAVFAVRCSQPPASGAPEERPVLPGAPAPAAAADRI